LLVHGITRYEVRRQGTAYRGRVAVHVGAAHHNGYQGDRAFPVAHRVLCRTEVFREALRSIGVGLPAELPTQALLGTVALRDCVAVAEFDPRTLEFAGDCKRILGAPADWRVWVFNDPRPLPVPVLWRGKGGYCTVPDDLLADPRLLATPAPPTSLVWWWNKHAYGDDGTASGLAHLDGHTD
jgi:hypothetical protein